MGNNDSLIQQIQNYKPPLKDLIFKDQGNKFKIYQHRLKKYEIMSQKLKLSQRQLIYAFQNFKARYQHHYLVSTSFFDIEDQSTCGGMYSIVIYYQRIFTNLTKIKDIPFNDVLHFYAVAFKGFQLLFKRFGYFQIFQDMFHLGQDSKLKVWCNKDISKNQPQKYLIDEQGTEEDMIRKIIYVIHQNTDHQTQIINVKNTLISFGIKNFQMANHSLRQICKKHNFNISQRVNCLTALPSQEVQAMLDLYTSNVKNQTNFIDNTPNTNIQITLNPIQKKKIEYNHQNIKIFNSTVIPTPHFNHSQYLKTPIIQQFQINENKSKSLQISNTSINNKNNQNMLQTFNKKPQIPISQRKKGIDLSLIIKNQNVNSPIKNLNMFEGKVQRKMSTPILSNVYLLNKSENQNSCSQDNIAVSHVRPNLPTDFLKNATPEPTRIINGPMNFLPLKIPHPNIHIPVNKKQIRTSYHFNKNTQAIQSIQTKPAKINRTSVSFNYKPNNQINQAIYTKNKDSASKHQKSSIIIQNIQHKNFNPNNVSINSNSYKRPSSVNIITNISPQKIIQNKERQIRNSSIKIQHNNKNQNQTLNNNLITFNPTKNFLANPTLYINSPKKISIIQSKGIQQNNSKINFSKTSQTIYISPQKYINNVHNNMDYLKLPKKLSKKQLFDNQNYFNNINSSSSRYYSSNRQINNNFSGSNQIKKNQQKKMGNIFDPKIIQLQSYAESNLNDQQNSRVLQIVGRQQNDSITSAFVNEEKQKKIDYIKQQNYKEKTKKDTQDNSFTDPKIWQILKKPSYSNSQVNKALLNDLSNLKKAGKGTKKYQFQTYKKIQNSSSSLLNDQTKFQTKLAKKQPQEINIQNQLNKYQNSLNNLNGFPSLSNLSQINKIQQYSFNDDKQKVNSTLNMNKNNQNYKKSRFTEEKNNFIKNQQKKQFDVEFYKFDYQIPKYQYTFSGTRQVPMKDNQVNNWNYSLSQDKQKDDTFDSSKVKNSQNKKQTQMKFNQKINNGYQIGSFNSNSSLASLQWQLNKKPQILRAQINNRIQQEVNQSSQTIQNSSVRIQQHFTNRKYNPKIDPQINKDLQRLRQIKKIHKVK